MRALNSFYEQFLNQCIQTNIDYAAQQDQNDFEANVRTSSKVLQLANLIFWFLFVLPVVLLQVVISGFQGTSYPEDQPGQRLILQPLIQPLVDKILGEGTPYDINPRRGVLRGSAMPPCEVDLGSTKLATKFRAEAARLSKAKQEGMAHLYFNPCVTLATRYVITYVIYLTCV